jgi:hypothetical protein
LRGCARAAAQTRVCPPGTCATNFGSAAGGALPRDGAASAARSAISVLPTHLKQAVTAPPGRGSPSGAPKASGHRPRHAGGVGRPGGHARADSPLRSQASARLRARQTGAVAGAVSVGGLKVGCILRQRRFAPSGGNGIVLHLMQPIGVGSHLACFRALCVQGRRWGKRRWWADDGQVEHSEVRSHTQAAAMDRSCQRQ